MKYNFDKRIDRRRSDSGKWNYFEEGVIPMWVADMDFVSPEPVVRALSGRAEHGVFGYPISASERAQDTLEMRSLLTERLFRLYGWQVQPEEIVFIPGVVNGFNLACHALAEEAGAVLVQPPVYHPMLHAPGNARMQRQEAPLLRNVDGSYAIDFDAFESAIDAHTRLFILCNPHNPVGRVFRKEELSRMAESCLRKDVVICSDEIHCDLLYSGQKHTPIASLDPEVARNTITLMAPTKAFNMPGLQFAFAIIPDAALRARYMDSGKGLLGWINLMGWTAARAAFQEGQDWLNQLLSYLEGNRDVLFDFVRNNLPGINLVKPEGTYLAWLDCRDLGIEGKLDEFFLKNARIAIANGAMFGTGGEGFVRMNFGCPRSVLVEALKRIGLVLG